MRSPPCAACASCSSRRRAWRAARRTVSVSRSAWTRSRAWSAGSPNGSRKPDPFHLKPVCGWILLHDVRRASELGRDACFLAGLARYDAPGEAHRPEKILYALAYREDPVKPTFVVDISAEFETKLEAIRCYASQFDTVDAAGEIFPTGQQLYDLVRVQNAHYGSLIRAAYGEPFMTQETVRVDDVVTMGVRSM